MLSKEQLDSFYRSTAKIETSVAIELNTPQTMLNKSDLQELETLLDKAMKCLNVMHNRLTGIDIS